MAASWSDGEERAEKHLQTQKSIFNLKLFVIFRFYLPFSLPSDKIDSIHRFYINVCVCMCIYAGGNLTFFSY